MKLAIKNGLFWRLILGWKIFFLRKQLLKKSHRRDLEFYYWDQLISHGARTPPILSLIVRGLKKLLTCKVQKHPKTAKNSKKSHFWALISRLNSKIYPWLFFIWTSPSRTTTCCKKSKIPTWEVCQKNSWKVVKNTKIWNFEVFSSFQVFKIRIWLNAYRTT